MIFSLVRLAAFVISSRAIRRSDRFARGGVRPIGPFRVDMDQRIAPQTPQF
jgi:hypothetical protein